MGDKEKKETSKRPVNALAPRDPRDEDREKNSRKVDKETGIKVRDVAAEDARDVTKDNKDDGRKKKVVVLRKRSPSAKDRKSKRCGSSQSPKRRSPRQKLRGGRRQSQKRGSRSKKRSMSKRRK